MPEQQPMTLEMFMQAVEAYFGKLNDTHRKVMLKHMREWSGHRRRAVWEYLKRTREVYPNKPLSIAEIERAREHEGHPAVDDVARLPEADLADGAVSRDRGAEYIKRILGALRDGVYPREVYAEFISEESRS